MENSDWFNEYDFGPAESASGVTRVGEMLKYEYKGAYVWGYNEEELEQAKRRVDERQCEVELERQTNTIRAMVGQRLLAASLEMWRDTPANSKAKGVAAGWLESPTDNLIIVGPIGSGKTYLMACLCRALVERGWRGHSTDWGDAERDAYWLSAPGWVNQVKRGFRSDDEAYTAENMLALAKSAGVLFLDDLGKVHPGANGVSWLEDQFYGLVDSRYRKSLPTVVTTEWNRDALAERVGSSVVSRLMDGALIAGMDAYEWRKPQ